MVGSTRDVDRDREALIYARCVTKSRGIPTGLADRITRLPGLVPEQVTSRAGTTTAALMDQWSRLHELRETTVIGRDAENTIGVLQTSVSRRHAELAFAGHWTIRDLGSRNGTFVDGVRITGSVVVPERALVVIGEVGFVLIGDRSTLPAGNLSESHRATAQAQLSAGTLRISPPTTEGAGMLAHGDATVMLGSTQFALVRLLAERYLAGANESDELRGFTRSIELIANLPWNTAHPDDNHLKQQVRRVRKALEDKLGLPDAIESRHGLGYRLRVVPILL